MLIYVLGTEDLSKVKIGRTTQAAGMRRRQNEGSGPGRQTLRFAAGVWGSPKDEKQLHRCFRAHLLKGEQEWFHAGDEILEWLRWLRHQPYVSIDENGCDSIPRTTSENWLPATDRSVPLSDRLIFDPWDALEYPDLTGDDYYTDTRIIEAARATMGHFDLDPASHPVANTVVQARHFYTIASNGLAHPWAGRVWVNPPFGKWEAWGNKIVDEWRSGRVEQMCVLLATRTLTAQCVAPMLATLSSMCILRGRIPFWGPHAGGSPDDGHAILYFGQRQAAFNEHFSLLGNCFTPTTNPA